MTDGPRFDVADLTLLEVGEIEEALGATLDSAFTGPLRARAMGLVAWTFAKRDDPAATLDDVMRSVRMRDIGDGPPTPT